MVYRQTRYAKSFGRELFLTTGSTLSTTKSHLSSEKYAMIIYEIGEYTLTVCGFSLPIKLDLLN